MCVADQIAFVVQVHQVDAMVAYKNDDDGD
jgi:hypothetical protein